MQLQIFKSARPNELTAEVQRFIDEDQARELRDVKVAYGCSTDGGMLDQAIVVAVLYDVREPESDAERLEGASRRIAAACRS